MEVLVSMIKLDKKIIYNRKAVKNTQTCIAKTDQKVSGKQLDYFLMFILYFQFTFCFFIVEQHEKLQSELLNMKEKQEKEIQPLVESMKEKIKHLQGFFFYFIY